MGIRRPIVSVQLVGRRAELDIAAEVLGASLPGRGPALCVSGEAGIGKSRFVREVVARQSQREQSVPFDAIEVRCFEFDRSIPYALARNVLRALHDTPGPATPAIREATAFLDAAVSTPAAGTGDSAEFRWRIREQVTSVLSELAVSRPLLLVLEDLHWCDDASLEWVAHLALREVPRLALVATYRIEQSPPALEHLVAELARRRRAVEIELAPLPHREARSLIASFGRALGPAATDAIASAAEGNPLYIEELVGAMTDVAPPGNGHIELPVPRSVLEAVKSRFELLRDETQRALLNAAVVGRSFDLALLEALLEQDEASLLVALREALEEGFLVEERAGGFAFRHALTREAILSRLLATERRAVHGRVAELLQRLAEADAAERMDYLGDLAYHYFHAEQWEAALRYSAEMADLAQRLFAPRSALVHYTRALDAERHLGGARSAGLRLSRGTAHEALGEIREALDDYEAGLALARASGDQRGEWAALLHLGAAWTSQDYEHAGAYFDEALAVAEGLRDAAAVGDSLNRRANWALNVGRPAEAVAQHSEALRRFRELGDVPRIAATLDLLGMTGILGGDLAMAASSYEEAIALARDLDNRALLASSLASLSLCDVSYQTATMVRPALPPSAGVAAAEEALAICRAIDWRAGEAYALIFLGFARGARGEYAMALRAAEEGLRIAEEIDHRQWRTAASCALAALHLDLEDAHAALSHSERARALAEETRSTHWIGCAGAYHALALAALGRTSAATDALGRTATPATLAGRLAMLAAAEVALMERRPDDALAMAEALAQPGGGVSAAPRVGLVAGRALHDLRRLDAAEFALRAALGGAETSGAASLQWRLAAALADVLRDRRRRAEADAFARRARSLIGTLAEALDDPTDAEAFAARALPAVADPGETPLRADRRRYGGLTRREREVAALVASGRTNREIAEVLVLGERTVESHVASALHRLAFSSRAQLAGWAVEVGLAEAPRPADPR